MFALGQFGSFREDLALSGLRSESDAKIPRYNAPDS